MILNSLRFSFYLSSLMWRRTNFEKCWHVIFLLSSKHFLLECSCLWRNKIDIDIYLTCIPSLSLSFPVAETTILPSPALLERPPSRPPSNEYLSFELSNSFCVSWLAIYWQVDGLEKYVHFNPVPMTEFDFFLNLFIRLK